MKKIISGTVAILSSLILLNSCSLNNSTNTQPQSGAFLVAQASPTAPPVSVYINSTTQFFDTLHFGSYSPYAGPITPGTYTFIVDSFGIANPSKLTSTVTIEANKYYSYFIIDSFSKVKAAFINDVFQKPSSDSVYIRFFNFCPNTTSPISLVTNQSSWASGRTFNDQSTNPQYVAFQEEPAGTYSFELKNISGTVLTTQSLILTGGKVYTLFAKGIIGGADSTALSIGQLENYPQQ